MFTATLLTRAKGWKQPSVQQWMMGKQNTVDPYNGIFSAGKRNEAVTQATTGTDLETLCSVTEAPYERCFALL